MQPDEVLRPGNPIVFHDIAEDMLCFSHSLRQPFQPNLVSIDEGTSFVIQLR